jgi:16S rRNA (adenine1518-N6/adenine1519-N6)-dimethyltransferase
MEPSPEKSQHFLIDKEVLSQEIKTAKLTKKDNVLEIGAGSGILTQELIKKAGSVCAVELDEVFKQPLKQLEQDNKKQNLKIIIGDALSINWRDYNKIVSNIPYNLSEQTINKAAFSRVKALVLIVGENFKEILEKNESKAGFIANLFYDIEYILPVKNTSFEPVPRVDSYLIKLELKNEKKLSDSEKLLQGMVFRDGKIKNAILYSLVEQGKTKNQAREIIDKMNFSKEVLEKPNAKTTGEFLRKLGEKIDKLKE